MGYLKYKGYLGSVEYSEEDGCLYGKVQGMSKDCISYEGNDIETLRKDFEGAVDDYIAACTARGVEPRKAFSGALNVRLTPSIHTKIAIAANELGTTINGYIKQVLEKQVASIVI